MTLLLQATGVTKSFGRRSVLIWADLEAHAGEVVAIVGENGVGKTTLLRICAGVVAPDGGTVRRPVRVGYCPQHSGLVDLLTADQHLVLFGAALGLDRAGALRTGRDMLESLAFPVGDMALVRDLSGGTSQKLNLAMALLGDPPVLLLDEPYQGFDRGSYVDFWQHVDEWRHEGRAVVVVTHLLAELQRVDRVVDLCVVRAEGWVPAAGAAR